MQLTEKESRYVKRMTRLRGVVLIVGSCLLFPISVVCLISEPRRFLRLGLAVLAISVLWLVVGIVVVRRESNSKSSTPPASGRD